MKEAREIIGDLIYGLNVHQRDCPAKTDQLIKALALEGYTIEQWIEFQEEDIRGLPDQPYVCDMGDHYKVLYPGSFHAKVKRYKAIGV